MSLSLRSNSPEIERNNIDIESVLSSQKNNSREQHIAITPFLSHLDERQMFAQSISRFKIPKCMMTQLMIAHQQRNNSCD